MQSISHARERLEGRGRISLRHRLVSPVYIPTYTEVFSLSLILRAFKPAALPELII